MKVEKCTDNISCEMGDCKRAAEFVIRHEGMSAYNNLYICKSCANALKSQLRKAIGRGNK